MIRTLDRYVSREFLRLFILFAVAAPVLFVLGAVGRSVAPEKRSMAMGIVSAAGSFATPFWSDTTGVSCGADSRSVKSASCVSCDFIPRYTTSPSRHMTLDGWSTTVILSVTSSSADRTRKPPSRIAL